MLYRWICHVILREAWKWIWHILIATFKKIKISNQKVQKTDRKEAKKGKKTIK